MMFRRVNNVNSSIPYVLKLFPKLFLVIALTCIFSNIGINASNDYDCLIYPDMCNLNEICIERVCVPLSELENPNDQNNHNNKRLEEELYTSHNDFKGPIRIHKYDADSYEFDGADRDDDLNSLILQPESDADLEDLLDYPDSELIDIQNKADMKVPLIDDLNEDYENLLNDDSKDDSKDDFFLETEPITVIDRDLEETFGSSPISRPYLNLKREKLDPKIEETIENIEEDRKNLLNKYLYLTSMKENPVTEQEDIFIDYSNPDEKNVDFPEPEINDEALQEKVDYELKKKIKSLKKDLIAAETELEDLKDVESVLKGNFQNVGDQYIYQDPDFNYVQQLQQQFIQPQLLPQFQQQLMQVALSPMNSQQIQDSGYFQKGPFLFENSGIDNNGNPFLERQIVQSNIYSSPSEVLSENFKTDNLVSKIDNQIVSDQIDEQKLHTPLEQALTNIALVDQKQNFENIQDVLEKFEHHQLPGQQFNLINKDNVQPENKVDVQQENKDNVQQETMDNVQQEIMENVEIPEKDLMESNSAEVMQQQVKKDKSIEDNQKIIDLEKEVETKEKVYLKKFLGDRVQMLKNGKLIDDSYLYVQLDKKTTKAEAIEFLKYISDLTKVPHQWITDINVSENLIVFKVKNIDLDGLCELIQKNHQLILKEKNFNIVTCHRGNVQIKHELSNYENSKSLFIITLVSCLALLLSLIVLLSVFVARRKAHLRQRIVDGISTFKKKPFDDVEELVKGEDSPYKSGKFFSRVWPFKTKQDLCRSTNSTISPLTNTTTDLTNRCETFESPINKGNVSSTPIHAKSEDANESSRSSASS